MRLKALPSLRRAGRRSSSRPGSPAGGGPGGPGARQYPLAHGRRSTRAGRGGRPGPFVVRRRSTSWLGSPAAPSGGVGLSNRPG
ncbi:MAG: hypothetical protein NTY37_07030 [Methanothrix sp.]|nr:hypothetical protein [Methanothrix sp.]